MIAYLHDGTYPGLLCALAKAFARGEDPEAICSREDFSPDLLTTPISVTTREEKARKAAAIIRERISPRALEKVFLAFLSDRPEAGLAIYQYLHLGFRLGKGVDAHLSLDPVRNIDRLIHKVHLESHRMKGFLRFRKVRDFYYGPMEPDHDILTLITSHFKERLPREAFIIHDLKRELAYFHQGEEEGFAPFTREEARAFLESREDQAWEGLWRAFFQTVSVEGRENPRLQKGFMPRRYWKHLTEMAEEVPPLPTEPPALC